jgi:hypothetical protein
LDWDGDHSGGALGYGHNLLATLPNRTRRGSAGSLESHRLGIWQEDQPEQPFDRDFVNSVSDGVRAKEPFIVVVEEHMAVRSIAVSSSPT